MFRTGSGCLFLSDREPRAGLSRRTSTPPAKLSFAPKRPHRSAGLKFSPPLDEAQTVTTTNPPTPRNDRRMVFTSSEAARYLGVSLATIRRWTDAGHVSCYRTPGGQRRFSRVQLDEFILSMHREAPAARAPERRSAEVA
jgi:excisionase family DNA binding protein